MGDFEIQNKFRMETRDWIGLAEQKTLDEHLLLEAGIFHEDIPSVFGKLKDEGVRTIGALVGTYIDDEEAKLLRLGITRGSAGAIMGLIQNVKEEQKSASPSKRPKFSWSSEKLRTRVHYDPKFSYLRLGRKDVVKANVIPSKVAGAFEAETARNEDILLFCRDSVHEQFRFLREHVLHDHGIGFLYGPSGTGKSICTFAFAIYQETQDYVVTWIHLRYSKLFITQIRDDTISTLHFAEVPPANVFSELLSENELMEGKHLVILDGFRDSDHLKIFSDLLDWFEGNPVYRRALGVSSMSSGIKMPTIDRDNHRQSSCPFWLNFWYCKSIQMKFE